MGLSTLGLPLRVAQEWVSGLSAPDRLLALEALGAVDPFGVGPVPGKVKNVAEKLGWTYQHGILEVPAWPVHPPNPNTRMAWLRRLVQLVGKAPHAERVMRTWASAWGESATLGTSLLREEFPDAPQIQQALTVVPRGVTVDARGSTVPHVPVDIGSSSSLSLVPVEEEAFQLVPSGTKVLRRSPDNGRPRHFPLPPGARLHHGVKGDYYTIPFGHPTYPPEFEAFWRLYPKAVEKKETFGVWLAIDPSPEQVEEILRGAERYASNPYTLARGKQHVVYPSRWLQRGRWQDDDVPVPFRSEEEMSEHLERRPGGQSVLTPTDFEA